MASSLADSTDPLRALREMRERLTALLPQLDLVWRTCEAQQAECAKLQRKVEAVQHSKDSTHHISLPLAHCITSIHIGFLTLLSQC
jgi:hypothetical protein